MSKSKLWFKDNIEENGLLSYSLEEKKDYSLIEFPNDKKREEEVNRIVEENKRRKESLNNPIVETNPIEKAVKLLLDEAVNNKQLKFSNKDKLEKLRAEIGDDHIGKTN